MQCQDHCRERELSAFAQFDKRDIRRYYKGAVLWEREVLWELAVPWEWGELWAQREKYLCRVQEQVHMAVLSAHCSAVGQQQERDLPFDLCFVQGLGQKVPSGRGYGRNGTWRRIYSKNCVDRCFPYRILDKS